MTLSDASADVAFLMQTNCSFGSRLSIPATAVSTLRGLMFHFAWYNLGVFTSKVYFDLQKVKCSWQFGVYSLRGYFFNAVSFQVQVLLLSQHN